jgi:uncharacterized membrane protein YkvA (DUF1232 family)
MVVVGFDHRHASARLNQPRTSNFNVSGSISKSKKLNHTMIHELLNRFQAGLDRERLSRLAEEAMAFAKRRMRGRGFRSVIDDLRDFVGILRDGLKGRFPVAWTEVAKIGGAIAYLLCPVDLVLDAVPGVGLVDDVAVLAYVAGGVAETLKAYREWRGTEG